MKKAFSHNTHLNLSTKELLAHHDVVFRAPVCDFSYGLPLGDGESGYLLWFSEDTLHITINNTGLIDDLSAGREYCDVTEEINTSLRGGAQMSIKFPCPIFDAIYQKKFESRLALGDATANIHTETPFARADIRAFASHADKVAVLTMDADFDEAMPLSSELQRWGSRSFVYFYMYFRNKPEMGLDGTCAAAEDGCLCITQKLNGLTFCIAVKPVSNALSGVERINSRTAQAHFEAREHVSLTYYMTVAVADDVDSAKANALRQISAAEAKGVEAMYITHAAEWEDFWDKSYVSLPEKQDFLENLWYLNLYYSNSQMRGAYPARAQAGAWNVYHDFGPFPNFLHYDNEHCIFPLMAANHPELNETYFRFRRNQLPLAEAFAKNMMNGKGAYYTEICDFKGRMDVDTINNSMYNATPGSQLATYMYQHYLYTGDEEFLKDTALPVMRKTAEFYLDRLTLGEDGYYHLHHTTAYESPFVVTDDTITDMVMIRTLFRDLIPLLPEEEAAPYKEKLEKIAPFGTAKFLPDELDAEGRLLGGLGKGRKPLTDCVLSMGRNARLPDFMKKEDVPAYASSVFEQCFGEVRDTIGVDSCRTLFVNKKHYHYGFPETELSPIFPAGLVGIRDRGSELYNLLTTGIYMHADRCVLHCMMGAYMARLGITEWMDQYFDNMINDSILYPQGFAGDGDDGVCNFPNRWKRWNITERDTGEKSTVLSFRYRHFYSATLAVLALAVNETLLQSYDGTIRLFPAIKDDARVSFKLAATGGRLIHAVFCEGECDVLIECLRGGKMAITADHVKSGLSFTDADTGEALEAIEADGIYTLDTRAGQRIAVKSAHAELAAFERDYSRNMDVKHLGKAKLGTEKEL